MDDLAGYAGSTSVIRTLEIMVGVYLVFFGLWIVFTIVWQFAVHRRKSWFLRRINTFNILPTWTFFAPTPGIYDTHILYRDKSKDGEITGWQEVNLFEQRRPFHCLWNPLKRQAKLAVDAISELKSVKMNAVREGIDEETLMNQVKFSKGYLILLNIVFGYPKHTEVSVSRQFVVLDASHIGGQRNLVPIFQSSFHRF
jgi:hypothetical protein